MFNSTFYPSTDEVIDLMVAPFVHTINWGESNLRRTRERYLRGVGKILEPNIGKCNIADRLVVHYGVEKKDILCCEIEDELAMIATGKGYRLIERDFLALSDPYHIDTIIMNPPFINAAEHILKAWEVLGRTGGQIVSQINADNIRYPHTFEHEQLIKLITQHGSVEFVGQPYLRAERPTDVEVAIVRLEKPKAKETVDFGGAFDYDQEQGASPEETFADYTPVSADAISRIAAQYNACRAAILEREALGKKFFFYGKGIKDVAPIVKEIDVNVHIDSLKKKFWQHIFEKTKIADMTTSKVKEEFDKFVATTCNLAFTEANIIHILRILVANSQGTMQECVSQVFDRMISYDKDNKIHNEGWLTNDGHRVNRKVILPIRTKHWYDNTWATWWDTREQNIADDIDKAICFVVSKQFTQIKSIHETCIKTCGGTNSFNNPGLMVSEFFEIRIYKKGTIHIKFRDEDVWERFNIMAAQQRNWIGADAWQKYERRKNTKRK